jgi:hypothetical protein
MGLLRIIWEDILWLNSRSPIVKFIACATAIFLLLGRLVFGHRMVDYRSLPGKERQASSTLGETVSLFRYSFAFSTSFF